MQHRTLSYRNGQGWSGPLPNELDGRQTLVLAFGAPELAADPEPFNDLAAAFPNSVVVGCSTAGEIAGVQVHDASISLAVAQFDHTRLKRAVTTIDGAADSYRAGARLGSELSADGLRAVFVLSEGLSVNGTLLVAGLAAGLAVGVSITGGLAGDGSRFARTWVLDGGLPETRRVSAVGFYGDRLRVGHGCDAGWSDFGPERRITRAEGNVLYELDGKPALELYKTYLGDRAQGLPGTALLFPLMVRRDAAAHERPQADDIRRPPSDRVKEPWGGPLPPCESLVRTILAVDEVQQSLTFAGDMPQGGIARLMRANTDKLIGSAGIAARQAASALSRDDDALVVSVSCVGRRLVLGERTDEEVETVVDGAPAGSAHVGFYSYGEISPTVVGGVSNLHNQTMTVTMFSEALA